MSQIITLTNQKGGVGKTTSCGAIISGLHAAGYRTLGIDLDPQGNLGFSLGVDIEQGYSMYEVMKGTAPVSEALLHTDNGDLIPSNILLSSAELEFSRAGREFLLRDIIRSIEPHYDYIVIDTPPALNILTVNAYVASNHLIIPMVPEILSLLGTNQLKETISVVRKFYNPDLQLFGILFTKYNNRVNLTSEVMDMATTIAQQLGTEVLDVTIRSSIVTAEAPAHGESVLTYAPTSTTAMDYSALVQQIISRVRV